MGEPGFRGFHPDAQSNFRQVPQGEGFRQNAPRQVADTPYQNIQPASAYVGQSNPPMPNQRSEPADFSFAHTSAGPAMPNYFAAPSFGQEDFTQSQTRQTWSSGIQSGPQGFGARLMSSRFGESPYIIEQGSLVRPQADVRPTPTMVGSNQNSAFVTSQLGSRGAVASSHHHFPNQTMSDASHFPNSANQHLQNSSMMGTPRPNQPFAHRPPLQVATGSSQDFAYSQPPPFDFREYGGYPIMSPFEVRHRRRTTRAQFKVLEETFQSE